MSKADWTSVRLCDGNVHEHFSWCAANCGAFETGMVEPVCADEHEEEKVRDRLSFRRECLRIIEVDPGYWRGYDSEAIKEEEGAGIYNL